MASKPSLNSPATRKPLSLQAPPTKDVLTTEIAAASYASPRSIVAGNPERGIDPARLGSLLKAAEQGDAIAYFELAERMEEKDLHYLAVLGTRKRAVGGLPVVVKAAGDEEIYQKDAALISDWLDRDTLRAEFFDILDAVGKGISACEIMWEFTAKSWLPSRIEYCDPRFFEFDRETGKQLLLRTNDGPQPLPWGKFIYHQHPAKSGLPIRGGLAFAVCWSYMFKNFAIRDWVTFLEGYGHPLRVGKYGPNESEANIDILYRALRDLGTDAAAAFPETMKVEFVDRKAGTAPNELWKAKAEYCDGQVSKATLGQTNTTDAQSGGLGSGQANVHNEVRGDIRDDDAMRLAATLNRDLVIPMVLLNHGQRDKYPRIEIGLPDEFDVKQDLENAEKLSAAGVRISRRKMLERSGLPEAEDDDDVFGVKEQVEEGEIDPKTGKPKIAATATEDDAAGGSRPEAAQPDRLNPLKTLKRPNEGGEEEATAASARNTPNASDPDLDRAGTNRDGIDRAIDENFDDWDALIDPVIEPVEAVIASVLANGGTLKDVQAKLTEAMGNMDVDAFAERLARSTFGAKLLGDVEARGKE